MPHVQVRRIRRNHHPLYLSGVLVMSKVPHISKTQLGSLLRCEAAFGYRYGEGIIQPPVWIMAYGNALEEGCNVDWRQKIESHESLPTADVVDAGVADWERRAESEEIVWAPGITPESVTDHMATALEVFHETYGVEIQPRGVQVEVEVPFGEVFKFTGHLDVVAEQGVTEEAAARRQRKTPGLVIQDVKTTGVSGGLKVKNLLEKWDHSLYTWAMRQSGVEVAGFEYLVSRARNGAKWLRTKKADAFDVTPDTAELNRVPSILQRFAEKKEWILRTGITTPNYSWACKGCGYRSRCHREFGRVPPE